MNITTKRLVIISLLIALNIVLSNFLSIKTPILEISFGFIAIALMAMLFGPMYAAIGAAIADVLGFILFPHGSFFPGFTLSAFLAGLTYGVFLHKHEKSIFRICMAVLIINIFINIGLDTLWLHMITDSSFASLLPPRIVKCAIMVPIQIALIRCFASDKIFKNLVRFAK